MGTNKEGRMSGLLRLCGDGLGFCRRRGGMLGDRAFENMVNCEREVVIAVMM